MDPYWLINHASLTGVRKPQTGAAAPQTGRAAAGSPFLAQIEQVLGVETEPDAQFFVESWTVGLAAAMENFQRRQELKSREYETPARNTFSSFTSWFVPNVESSTRAAMPIREQRSVADQRWFGDWQEESRRLAEEAMAGPMTVESARELLGTTATSTREQIRVAYRKMASRCHPDRLARSTPREQKLASDRMASINQAYELLCADLIERSKNACIM